VLTRTCFRDNAFLTHPLRKQALAETVVDLVCARVIQIFTLEIDLRATPSLRQPICKVERRRTAGIVVEEVVELPLKSGVAPCFKICRFQFPERMHESLWNELSAVFSEMTFHGVSINATSAR
jgi:hypothetical protein